MHTHRDYFKQYLEWYVETGTCRFFDLHVTQTVKGDRREIKATLLGLEHFKFMVYEKTSKEKLASEKYL